MSGKTVVVWSCAHADPSVSNERFDWLGRFIYDLKPDMCIDLGDGADMRSLNSYDTRYPAAIVSQSYAKDIESYNDSQERLRAPFKYHKRKRPFWVGFEGNHCNRIKKAIAVDPRLEGQKYGISFGHLQTSTWFDEYHEYTNSAPAIADYDGVSYAHYFGAGNYGRPVSGTHHAFSLLSNRNHSSTCGHSHKRSVYFKDSAHPKPIIGLVAGCFKGAEEAWAGQANAEWAKGIVVKRELRDGVYDPQWISMEFLQREYGS
jgi:hypothetical protein